MDNTQDIKLSFICIVKDNKDYISTINSILNQETQYKYKILLGVLDENELNSIENVSKANPAIIDYVLCENKTEAECIEALVNNEKMQETFEDWQERFKEIKDVEVPKITDALIEIEDCFNEKRYNLR